MRLSSFDIFSQHFQFNVEKTQLKQSTLIGAISSAAVIIIAASYYIYLINLYLSNQIDPIYKSQNVISEDRIDINLDSSFVGFRYEYDTNKSIDLLQAQNNKTYLIQIAQFYYSDDQNTYQVNLDIQKCTNPNLIGFYCIDFSKLLNETLSLSSIENIYSYIAIITYGCLDLDIFKTTIPDNCATQSEIDQVINKFNSGVRLKLLTSQFNTATKKTQIGYKTQMIYASADQLIYTTFKIQKQVTTVKQGLFILKQQNFSSPIQYNAIYQSYDRQYSINNTNWSGFSFVQLEIDEIVQEIKIQYPTIPEILALGNSILTLLMFVGVFGKVSSFKKMRNNFFMLFMQNLFQESYLKILKVNSLLENRPITVSDQQILNQIGSNINSEELEFSEHKEEIQSFNNNKNNYKSQRIKTKWQVDQQNVIQEFENKFKYENLKISTLYSPKETKRLHIKLYSKKNMENLQNLKAMYDLNFSSIVHKNIFKTKQ